MKLTEQKARIILFLAVSLAVMIGLYFTKKNDRAVLNWGFNGPVEKVWYDVKDFPHVTLKGKEYNLDQLLWNFNYKIFVGDTIIKNAGDYTVKIIKSGTQDTIYFIKGNPSMQIKPKAR